MVIRPHLSKVLTLLGMLLIIYPEVFAQSRGKKDSESETVARIVGRNYQFQENIPGKEIILDGQIRYLYPDSITHSLFVQLEYFSKGGYPRNKGTLLVWDTDKEKTLWRENINNEYEELAPVGNALLLKSEFKTRCFDRMKGKELWDNRNIITYVHLELGIAMGYKSNYMSADVSKLEGLNLRTGKKEWERKIYSKYSWADMRKLNDSVILMAADALYSINMKNGTGWRQEIFVKELPFPKGEEEFMQGFISNIYVEGENIYIASCDRLFCLDYAGKVLWVQGVPRKFTGESLLFSQDSTLYMVNQGAGTMGVFKKSWGTPYIAAFDKRSGLQQYFTAYPHELGKVNHVQVRKDTLYALFDKCLVKSSLRNMMKGIKIQFSENKDIGKYFVGESVFVQENSKYKSLYELDSTNFYILTEKQDILCIGTEMKTLRPGEYHMSYLTYRGYHFIASGEESIVINPFGEFWAHLRISQNAIRVGNKLYDAQDNKIVIVDLDEVVY